MSLQKFQRHVPLSLHTTFRIGGPANAFYEAKSADEVIDAVQEANNLGLRWIVIGHGSNILASDRGYEGAVIVFKDDRPPCLNDDGTVTASGGMDLLKLIDFMAEKGVGSLENLAGIPGTVGGALAGNAGAYGTAIGDSVLSVNLLDKAGRPKKVLRDELSFSYRSSDIKKNGFVVLQATFSTKGADPAKLKSIIDERLTDRAKKHPDPKDVYTAGSFFKNPSNAEGKRIAAGKLLEEAGCKELKVGNARLWHSHANIIVADNGATSKEVNELAHEMAKRVLEKSGITLVPEVLYLE